MATITSAQSGNFSSTSTWVGGVVPVAADIAVAANGHVVAIDTDVTVTKVTQVGTGKFTLGNGRTLTAGVEANAGTFTSGGTVEVTATTSATITGDVTGVTTTASNIGAVVVTGSGTLTVNGRVQSSSGNGIGAGIYINTPCSVVVNGNVYGSTGSGTSGTGKRGIWLGTSANNASVSIIGEIGGSNSSNSTGVWCDTNSASLTALGNILGGNTTWGIYWQGGQVTITGNLIGGYNSNASALDLAGAISSATITGSVSLQGGNTSIGALHVSGSSASATVIGSITYLSGEQGRPVCVVSGNSSLLTVIGTITVGGSSNHGVSATGPAATVTVTGTVSAGGSLSHGIISTATTNGVIVTGNLTDSSQGAVAVYSRLLRVNASPNSRTVYANSVGFPNGASVVRASLDVAGDHPVPANVRQGTTYAYGQFTGAMAVPSPSTVSFGVPVDNTVGTALVTVADLAAVTGAQIAAALST